MRATTCTRARASASGSSGAPAAAARATPTPTPTPTPTADADPDADDADHAHDADGRRLLRPRSDCPPPSSCAKGGKLKFKLKAPRGTKVVSATVAVNGKVKARVKGKVRKPVTLKKLKKTFKVTGGRKASNGKTYKATRIYRVCG